MDDIQEIREAFAYKRASYAMAVMDDPDVDAVLRSSAKAEMLQDSMTAVSQRLSLAIKMQTYATFIKDESQKQLVIKQCDEALQEAIKTMATALK